jgi:predicted RNA-binding protein YlqC (UPF0109 family)
MSDEDVEFDEASDGEDTDDAGNDVATAQAVLKYVVSALVEDDEAVRVDVDDSKRTLQLEVRVGPDDMGRVIGRRGRVANAIRTLTRAAAARDGVEVDIEFVD